ncbi:DUF998 domain-containing protein [Microbacterium pumilum]|uniref:DUF998 domain-containing protein n=1 Tax=Microbacterium pumilum TaxID=344165 RepID=A0ABP5DBC2_9MICO
MTGADVAAITAIVAGMFCVVLIGILHFVEPEYDPSWRMISEYSLGSHGWLMRVGFIAMAVSPAAIGIALWPFGGAWTVGLAIVAAGAIGAAFVDADSIMTPRAAATRVGRAHTVLGSVLLIGFPVAALMAGLGSADGLGWTLALASALPWATLLWFLRVSSSAHGQGGSPAVRVGWPDRACLVAYLAWVVLAAAAVLSS